MVNLHKLYKNHNLFFFSDKISSIHLEKFATSDNSGVSVSVQFDPRVIATGALVESYETVRLNIRNTANI